MPRYRKQGLTKYAINFSKKLAKRRKENRVLASIPLDAQELQTIFRKCNFKNNRLKTQVYFDDCMFGMLNSKQFSHLDLSKSHRLLKWQELVMEL